MIETDGSVPMFLANKDLGSLSTAHFMALRPSFSIRQAQRVQVFLLKLMPLCKLSAGLGSTSKSATSLSHSLVHLAPIIRSLFFFCPAVMGYRLIISFGNR